MIWPRIIWRMISHWQICRTCKLMFVGLFERRNRPPKYYVIARSAQRDVAIPYDGATRCRCGKREWLRDNSTFFSIISSRKIHGIATPVCALARNDVLLFGACNSAKN